MLSKKQIKNIEDRPRYWGWDVDNDIRALLKEVKRLKKSDVKLRRQLKHAMHAITAASNGFSHLIAGNYPYSDVPIMLNRVRELEILALDRPTPKG